MAKAISNILDQGSGASPPIADVLL